MICKASQVALVVKNLLTNAGDARDADLIPREGNGNTLQYSCLENSMDRGPWQGLWGLRELDMTEHA